MTQQLPEDKIPASPTQNIFLWWWWMQLSELVIWPAQFIALIIGGIAGIIWPNIFAMIIIYLIGYLGNLTIGNVRSGFIETIGRTTASLALGYLTGNLLWTAGFLIKKFLL